MTQGYRLSMALVGLFISKKVVTHVRHKKQAIKILKDFFEKCFSLMDTKYIQLRLKIQFSNYYTIELSYNYFSEENEQKNRDKLTFSARRK